MRAGREFDYVATIPADVGAVALCGVLLYINVQPDKPPCQLCCSMDQFSDRHNEPKTALPHAAIGLHAPTPPKTWFGKVVAAIVGLAVLVVALFLSIFAFAVAAGVAVVAIAYVMWAARRSRRAAESQIIDNDVGNPGRR